MKRILFISLLILGLTSCVEKKAPQVEVMQTLRIAGSDTMYPLARRWATSYMQVNPNLVVEVAGGGSRTGVDKLIAGDVDICTASRTLLPDEVKRLHQRRNSLGMSTLTAKDHLTIFLNPYNPVENLTLKQLKQIFRGKITNWSQVGGANRPIKVVSRPPNSGTRQFLQEVILEGEAYSGGLEIHHSTAAVVAAVSENIDAIGYGGFIYTKGAKVAEVEGVMPGPAAGDDEYPLTRYLYLYTVSPVEGLRRDFLKWVVGEDGQRLVKEEGYLPLWSR